MLRQHGRGFDEFEEAFDFVRVSNGNLFSVSISSRNTKTVERVIRMIRVHVPDPIRVSKHSPYACEYDILKKIVSNCYDVLFSFSTMQ